MMANIAYVTFRLINKLKHVNQSAYVCVKTWKCGKARQYSAAAELHDYLQTSGPIELLNKKIANGDLFKDETQQKITKQLQQVFDDIENYKPQEDNLFSKWFSAKKEAPRGLYIYGAVGGGKTMLMDLFYECCEVRILFQYIIGYVLFSFSD